MMRAASAVVFLIAFLPADVLGQISSEDRYRILPHFGVQFFSTDRAGFFVGMTYRPSFESDREAFWAPVLGGEVGIAGGQLNLGLSRYFRPVISDVGGIGSANSAHVRDHGTEVSGQTKVQLSTCNPDLATQHRSPKSLTVRLEGGPICHAYEKTCPISAKELNAEMGENPVPILGGNLTEDICWQERD